MKSRYLVPDPFWTRARAAWNRLVWCRIVGHDELVKMNGTVLCRRH